MRTWLVALLAAGAVLAGAPILLGDVPIARALLLAAAGAALVAAVIGAVARHRPADRLVWLVFALAAVALVVADTLRSLVLTGVAGGDWRAAQIAYGVAYPLLAGALLLAVRRGSVGRRREFAIDAALLAVAAGLVFWPYLFDPWLQRGDGLLLAAELAQPVGGILALAAVGSALLSASRLLPVERLLVAGILMLFAGDVVHVSAPVLALPAPWAEASWIFAYALLAAAALHPSMRAFGGAHPARGAGSARRRLVIVVAVGLATPGILLVQAILDDVNSTIVAAGATVFIGLVVVRFALLVADADRLRTRAELSETRLRMLFEAAPIGISLPPEDEPLSGRFAETNRALQEMLGYTREELAQLDWRDLTVGGTRERDEALQEELVAGVRQSYRVDKLYRRKDGSVLEAELHVSFARAEDGSPLLAVGLIEDETERRRAQRRLVESEQRLGDLLGGIDAMVWECSAGTWGYTFVSGGVEQLLGFPVEDWLADPDFWVGRVHPDDRERVVAQARDGEAERTGWAIEYRMLHADGRPVWVRDVVQVVLDAEGRPERLRGVLVDITAGKEAEEERRLLFDQLRQKQKVEALGQLAGGVAHDFNNLLTAITGYVELAQRRAGDDPKLGRHLEGVHRSAERAAALTRQLLAFGRRQLLSPRVIELNGVVDEVAELVLRLVGDAVEIRLDLHGSAPRVEADPNQLEQVIINLAVNARDAMPQGGTVTIGTGRRAVPEGLDGGGYAVPPGEYAFLEVTDTGSGMPEGVRRRAFDPFFTTKPNGEGTGLGLSTVYGIVKQSGGFVDLQSAPGRGTTVTVLLPATDEAAAAPSEPERIAPPVAEGETILLVEDEPAVRTVVSTALEEDGYRVLVAAGGVEGLAVAAEHQGPIQLVLSDVSMPRMGGIELLARCAVERPEARALLMTGYADSLPSDVPVLRKPFSLAELREGVRRVLSEDPALSGRPVASTAAA